MSTKFFNDMIPAMTTIISSINDDNDDTYDDSINWNERLPYEYVEMLPSKLVSSLKSEGFNVSYSIDDQEDVIFHVDGKNISMTTSCNYWCDDIWFMVRLE